MPELADHDEQISGFAARRRNDALPLARLTLPQPAHPAKNMPQRLAERLKSVARRFADAGKILEVLENFFGSLPILMRALIVRIEPIRGRIDVRFLDFRAQVREGERQALAPAAADIERLLQEIQLQQGFDVVVAGQMSLTI